MKQLSFDDIKKDVKNDTLAPIYVLYGPEAYFTDELVTLFEGVIPEADKEFSQYIFYAPQADASRIVEQARQVPFMSERQVVIVKECQGARADFLDKFKSYVASPSPSTVFVMVFRGEEMKGAELKKALKASTTAIGFESKRVYENQLPALINNYVKGKKLSIEHKALEMLKDFIGTDLSTMFNQIDKLASILPSNATITPEAVENHVGISREYNPFELVDAIAIKDASKAFRIAKYFEANPKVAPVTVVLSALFNYFADLMVAWYNPDRSEGAIAKVLGLNSSFKAKRYTMGLQYYSPFAVVEIIDAIRQTDVRSKGVDSRQDPYALLHDLLYVILTTDGSRAKAQ